MISINKNGAAARIAWAGALCAAVGLVPLLAPSTAKACGGTFCDAGPTVMPVDQTGENILFWIDDSGGEAHTEAHIQIQYEGDAESFAWIVPVAEAPEVLVGSQALFDNLLAATIPTIVLNTRTETDCPGDDNFSLCGGIASFEDIDGAGFTTFGDDGGGETGSADSGGGPEIIERGVAGAFEYVVLTGETIDVVIDWLDQAGYAQDDDAPPILDEYLQEDFVFVAFKLRGGVGVDEIHPLAIRYPGVEPCIPIRLTRIAAVEDMSIRAFFLGGDRVAPQNWPHVELNLAKLDWLGGLANSYRQLVSAAIDEAGGRAFITEYAGTDSVVSNSGISSNQWNSAPFVGIDPVDVIPTMAAQNLLSCGAFACTFRHPQVRPILQRYLPAPANLDEEEYWADLGQYIELLDPDAWAAQPGLAAELDERIFGPGSHALAMLADSSYLTRLFTLLSPHEMLEDPLFHEVSGLPTVDSQLSATRVFACNEEPDYVELADGRTVALDFSAYPAFTDMPAAERIEQVPAAGPPQVETDNGPDIDDLVEAHNRTKLIGPSPSCATSRVRAEHLLGMFALFGLVWLQRSPRRSRVD